MPTNIRLTGTAFLVISCWHVCVCDDLRPVLYVGRSTFAKITYEKEETDVGVERIVAECDSGGCFLAFSSGNYWRRRLRTHFGQWRYFLEVGVVSRARY